MSAANRGARYGLETPSSYGRIFPPRAVPTAKFLRAIRGCRRRFPARRTQGGADRKRVVYGKRVSVRVELGGSGMLTHNMYEHKRNRSTRTTVNAAKFIHLA